MSNQKSEQSFFKKHSDIFGVQFFVFAGLLLLCIVLLVTCRERPEEEDAFPDNPDSQIKFTYDEVTEQNLFEFVTLGQYKGIRFDRTVVTQQDIDDFVEEFLAEAGGSMIKGEPFPGGADQNAELWIGSGQFIPGFEEQIIGHNVGDEFDIYVTFPVDYHAELAGRNAIFEIRLLGIYEDHEEVTDRAVMDGDRVVIDYVGFLESGAGAELTDDFVRSLDLGVESVEEFLMIVRERMEEEALTNDRRQVFNAVHENAVFHKVNIDEVEQRTMMTMQPFYFEAAHYGIEIEDFIAQVTQGMSIEDFIEFEVRPYAVNDVTMDLVIRAVAAQEGISLSDAEFEEGVRNYIEQHGYDSIEHFMQFNSVITISVSLLADKIIDVLMDNAIPN